MTEEAEEEVDFPPKTEQQTPHFLRDVIFHGKFRLLKALTPEENTRCQHGIYFQDGQRRVDYVLTYPVKKPAGGRSSRQSSHRFTENAVARSLRRGPRSRDKHVQHHQSEVVRDSSLSPTSSPETSSSAWPS